ncbi:hypothetical protein KCU62_g80, partial [Aureobasidium sp. EXF-3399]
MLERQSRKEKDICAKRVLFSSGFLLKCDICALPALESSRHVCKRALEERDSHGNSPAKPSRRTNAMHFDSQRQAPRSIHKSLSTNSDVAGYAFRKVSNSRLPAQWYGRHGARPVPSVTCHDRGLSLPPKYPCSVFCIFF